MNKNDSFPIGTLFSGDFAFVPKPGGGFETVKIKNANVEGNLHDDLSFEELENHENNERKQDIEDIEFNVDFDFPQKLEKSVKPKDKQNKTSKNKVIKKKADKEEIYKNIHKGRRERLRKRYEDSGISSFAPHEVLEFLLYFVHEQKDTNAIAHALIDEFGDIHKVFKAEMFDLETVSGVGRQSALLINFCRQLITYLNANITDKPCLNDTTTTGLFCCNYFMQHVEETFITIMLDTNRCVQKVVVISRGTENETAFYPRNILKAVIKHRANMVVIAHNHTGNSVHPSNADIHLSGKIATVLEGINVPLIDHIICCGNLFTSLSERGLLEK